MINKEPKRYLWIRPNSIESPMLIIDDPVALFRGSQFDEEHDQLFEIGPEVKLEVNIKVVPTKPVYRKNASGYRVPFENRD